MIYKQLKTFTEVVGQKISPWKNKRDENPYAKIKEKQFASSMKMKSHFLNL